MRLRSLKIKFIASIMVMVLLLGNSLTIYGASTAVMSKLILSSNELTLAIGDTTSLVATGIYSDGSTENLTVYSNWNSEDASVASIYNGTITAKTEGVVTVVASYQGFTQSAQVTVTKKVKALTKDTQTLELRQNETSTINLTATYSDNTTANVSDRADWSSSNENVATVVNGTVKGLSSGTATITATYGKKTITVETKVEIVNRVEANHSQVSLLLQGTEQITLIATYADGTTNDITNDATWSSSNANIADVLKGRITAYSAGTATITGTYGSKSAQISVEVDKTVRLDVVESDIFLQVRGTKQLTLQAEYPNGVTEDVTSKATWSSNDEAIVYVSKGLLTGLKSGTATITAQYNDKSVDILIDVAVARHIAINKSKLNMNVGDTSNVTLTVTYADGTTEDVTSKASWSSDNETAAYVSKGTIKAYKMGTAKISGTYGGKTAQLTASVDVPTHLTTSTKEIYIEVDEAYQTDAIAVFADDHELSITDEATWSSSDESIAKVNNGLITGISSGVAKITASYSNYSVTIDANIEVARRIEASQTQVALLLNGIKIIALTATYANGTTKDISSLAQWSSSDDSVADSINGVITAYGVGTATITAAYGGKNVTIKVDVDKTANLTVSQEDVFLRLNGTNQLTLTAQYADGRTADVTNTAVWSSSNESVAYVEKGLITGYKSGTAIVTAKFNGKTVEINVDVEIARYLDINHNKLDLSAGDSSVVTVTATFLNGVTEDVTGKATWSSDNKTTAIVTDGLVNTFKMGVATIRGTYGGKTVTLTVSVDMPTKLTASSKDVRLDIEEEYQASLIAQNRDGSNTIIIEDATWSSNDEKIATVKDGLITGIAEGSTVITAEYGNQSVKITVKVGLADDLEASTYLIAMALTDTEQIRVTAINDDGEETDVTDAATWKSNKATVADVKKGLVKAIGKGKANITATFGGQSVSIAVEVDQVSLIETSEPSASMKSGETLQINASITFSDGQERDVTNIAEWKTANYKVATVNNGRIKAVGPGKTTITAKYGGKTVKIAVDVDTLKYFETSVVNLTMKVGDKVQVNAIATYMDQSEQDMSKAALWTSSKVTVATGKDGLIKANGKGKATITVTYAGKKAKVVVTVN